MKEAKMMNTNSEILVGLSVAELEASADTFLAPTAQHLLDELLARSKEKQLTASEEAALNGLLDKIDHPTILKTRARLTLDHQRANATKT
jgi:hypothetical protein